MALLSNDPNDPAEELAIRALTARFTDAVNRRDPATLGGLFAPDGEWVVPGMGETVGPAAVTAQLETLLSGFDLLVQLVHSGEVRVDGDRASARWYLSEVGRDAQGQGVHFVGVYQDRHVKVGGEWRFARRRFDFLYRGRTEMPGKGYPFPELEGGTLMSGLLVEQPADGVALLTLNRPDRLNAFDDELLTDLLPRTFADLAGDDSVRAVVVTGAGRGFSSGADLDCSGFRQPTPTEGERFVRGTHRTPVNVRKMGKPSIAAVNGPAIGAGFGLALACDIRLASPAARFGATFIAMGLVPDYGVSYFLPRVVGTSTALELLLTGRMVDAEEARALGIVSRVEEDVVGAAVELAITIAAHPPHATGITRANVYRSMELDLETEVLEQEPRSQAVALFGSEFPERFAAWTRKIQGR